MPDPIKSGTSKSAASKSRAAKPAEGKRTVVVTGGSRGLGLAIARRLAAAGYGVVAVARKMSDQLSGAMKEIPGAGSLDFAAFDLGDTQGLPFAGATILLQWKNPATNRHLEIARLLEFRKLLTVRFEPLQAFGDPR